MTQISIARLFGIDRKHAHALAQASCPLGMLAEVPVWADPTREARSHAGRHNGHRPDHAAAYPGNPCDAVCPAPAADDGRAGVRRGEDPAATDARANMLCGVNGDGAGSPAAETPAEGMV